MASAAKYIFLFAGIMQGNCSSISLIGWSLSETIIPLIDPLLYAVSFFTEEKIVLPMLMGWMLIHTTLLYTMVHTLCAFFYRIIFLAGIIITFFCVLAYIYEKIPYLIIYHPLIPLNNYHYWHLGIIKNGLSLMTLFAGLLYIVGALLLLRKMYLGILFYVLFFIIIHIKQTDPWLNHHALYAVLTQSTGVSMYGQAQDLRAQIESIIERQPNIAIILSTETAFTFPLNLTPQIIDLWYESGLTIATNLFIGAYYMDHHTLYNSLYWICNKKIIAVYHKNVVVPYVECCTFAHKKYYCTSYSGRYGNTWHMKLFNRTMACYPLICADVLKNTSFEPEEDERVLLISMSQQWCFTSFFKHRLYELALLRKALSPKSLLILAI